MKEDKIEYYPNGSIKHRINYYENGNKLFEQFFDLQEIYHREQGLPDYQKWYENGITDRITYCVHGRRHNIHNPCVISFFINGKIRHRYYYLNDYYYSKLEWQNRIKEI